MHKISLAFRMEWFMPKNVQCIFFFSIGLGNSSVHIFFGPLEIYFVALPATLQWLRQTGCLTGLQLSWTQTCQLSLAEAERPPVQTRALPTLESWTNRLFIISSDD
jgi:hypothetical protein